MSTILSGVRSPLAAAFSGLAANVFAYVPENVPAPAIVIIPDTDYLEPTLINKGNMTFKINLVISCAVAYNSNPASLDNLEQLVISVLALIPNGYELGAAQRPTVMQVGSSTLLVSDISVSTYYTQTI